MMIGGNSRGRTAYVRQFVEGEMMTRIDDEHTEQDALHFAIEREWKRDHVQRDFWRDHGYCRFYIQRLAPLLPIGPADYIPETTILPIAFAQLDRRDGRVMITTPLDPSYKWCIPLWRNKFGLIKTPLINPENIRVNA